jgi:hypothetical protein
MQTLIVKAAGTYSYHGFKGAIVIYCFNYVLGSYQFSIALFSHLFISLWFI